MANVLIIGAGLGGLAVALFLARRGHEAILIEKDADSPPDDANDCFLNWRRHGVAQARHAHQFNARACQVLQEEAPDVLEHLAAGGVFVVSVPRSGVGRLRRAFLAARP